MKRREFLKAAGAASVRPGTAPAQRPVPTVSDRDAWIAVARRLADPVLTNLANGTLKARMPVEQAAGADRRSVTHLEALGRLLAGLAPWIELPPDSTPEGRARAELRGAGQPRDRPRRRSRVARLPELHARSTAARRRGVSRARRPAGAARAARRARRHDEASPDRRARVDAHDRAAVQQLAAVFGDGRSGAEVAGRGLGSHARGLRAAPARAVVQRRRRLRRRTRLPLGLLQQLRHPSDAARRRSTRARTSRRRGRSSRRR